MIGCLAGEAGAKELLYSTLIITTRMRVERIYSRVVSMLGPVGSSVAAAAAVVVVVGGSLDSAGAGLGAEEGGGVDGFEENPWLLPATKSAASGSSSGRSKSGTGAKKDLARTGENEVFISVLDPKTSTAGAVAGAVRVVGKKGAGSKNSNAHALVGQGAEEQISQVLSSKECTMNGAAGTAVVGSGGKMSKSKRKAQSQAQAQAAVGTESSSASEGSKGGGAPKEKLQLLSDTSQVGVAEEICCQYLNYIDFISLL